VEDKNQTQEEKRGFVLNTSITEIMLLLFFLLLLLLIFFLSQREDERTNERDKENSLNEENKILNERIRNLENKLNSLLENFEPEERESAKNILVSISRLQLELMDKKAQLDDMKNKINAYEQIEAKYKQKIPLDNIKDNDLKNIGKLAACEDAINASDQLKQEIDRERKSRNLAERDAAIRISEAMKKLKQCGGKGEEYVACWHDENGQIEYMFNIQLGQEGIVVQRAWPEEREQEMSKYKDAVGLVGRTVNLDEFIRMTIDPFNDSVTVPCRHFVRIYGKRSEMNPEIFKDYRGIQDHFYHWSGIN
jgi:hypothetical protein